MDLEIRRVKKNDLKGIFDFRASYIDMSFDDFKKYYEDNANYWFVVYGNDTLLGYCLGKKGERIKTYMQIDEIATNVVKAQKYIRKGIGTKLIKLFEKEVWSHGFETIGFGSGEKLETEQFYLKNNYIPIEVVAFGNNTEFDRVKISSYEMGKKLQKELHKKYKDSEVIFIFEKYIK